MQEFMEINKRPVMESLPGYALPACGAVEAPSESSVWPREHNLSVSIPDMILISLCSTARESPLRQLAPDN